MTGTLILTDKLVREKVEEELPEMAKLVKVDADTVVMHQDAFAAGKQLSEYLLLGMAIKYIGMHNKNIHIVANKE